MVGDFNVIRYPSERLDCNMFTPAMHEFSDVITELSMIGLPLKGGLYCTRANGFNPSSMSTIITVHWSRWNGINILSMSPKNYYHA